MFGVGYRYCDGLSRGCAMVSLVGRLAGDTTIDQAQAELAGLMCQLQVLYPESLTGRVAVVRLRPSLVDFTSERAWTYQREVIERLEALPGILAASPARAPASWRAQPATPARRPVDSPDPLHAYEVGTAVVGARYFKTLGVGVSEGREFDDRDTADGPRVAIVNETRARHFWPNGSAVGSQMNVGADLVEVVGVVKDLQ